MIRYGREGCEHDWVNRGDGWEEQCGAAVCLECGAFGCWCNALEGYYGILKDDKVGFEIKKRVMVARAVDGDANTNGKWVNPYIEGGKKRVRVKV